MDSHVIVVHWYKTWHFSLVSTFNQAMEVWQSEIKTVVIGVYPSQLRLEYNFIEQTKINATFPTVRTWDVQQDFEYCVIDDNKWDIYRKSMIIYIYLRLR